MSRRSGAILVGLLVAWMGSARAETPAPMRTTDVSLADVQTYWTGLGAVGLPDLSNSLDRQGLFVITGNVRNDSATPVRFVRLRFELLDDEGKTVASEEGFNRSAEAMLDSRRFGGSVEDSIIQITPIAPGATDTFRMGFVGEDTPRFHTHRVTVVEVE